MMDSESRNRIKKSLIAALGESKVFFEKSDLEPYSTDSYIRIIKVGEKDKYSPDFAVLPESTSDVQKVVMIASEHKIPIIPKGGGSNLAGMLAPTDGGILIDTIKMNKIIEVNVPNLYVTVQTGITLKELDDHLAKYGLALNQVQGSFKVATVGGSISTCGYPRKHQKYGTIADRIMSLEVVLADGRVLRTGPKVLYTSTGYRLHQLFVGAEGTLGVITEATLRVEPIPEAEEIIMAYYDDFWKAIEVSTRIKTSCVTFVGAESFEVPKDWPYDVPPDKHAIVIVDFEGTKGEVEAELAFVMEIIQKTNGILADSNDAKGYAEGYEMIWCGLRATTDILGDAMAPFIPTDRLKEFYEKVWNEIMPKYGMVPSPLGERCGLDVGRYEMAYGTFIVPNDSSGLENYEKLKREIAAMATSLGGSIAACMGVGLKHRDYLDLEFSDVALDIMRRIKATLDPDNIMNPGKKIIMKSKS